MSEITPRMKVEILEGGKWIGPFTVTALEGRSPDHLVLNGPSGLFELYNDAPFNVRPVATEEIRVVLELAHQQFGTTEDIITKLVINVYGGTFSEKREAAFNWLEDYTDKSKAPVCISFYETENKGEYVQFTFSADMPKEKD